MRPGARLILLAAAWLLSVASAVFGQTVAADRLTVGGTKLRPDASTTVRLDGLATTGGSFVVFTDADGDASERVLAGSDLPAVAARTDTTNTFSLLQTFTSGFTANGASAVNSTLGVTGLGTFSGGLSTTTLTANTLAAGGNLSVATTGGTVAPSVNIGQTLGSPTAMWNAVYARELRALTLVAQDVVSTIGGWLYVGPTTKLLAAAASGAGRIVVEHNEAAVNDRLYLSARSQAEIMVVTAGPVACSGNPAACGGISTGYYYDVTRGDASTGADNWLAGDAVMNTGVIGDCFIEQYAFTSLGSGTAVGPTVVGNCRTANSGYSWGPRWAIGQLNGLYGIATSTFGAAFGDPADTNTLITASYWKLRDGTTDKFSLDGATGNMSLTGNLTVGTSGALYSGATAYATGTGYWLDYNGGTPRFYIGNGTGSTSNYLTWNGTTLSVQGALVSRGGINLSSADGSGNAIYSNLTDLRMTATNAAGGITLLSATGGLTFSTVGGSVSVTANGSNGTGVTATKTVRDSAGTGTCTLVFVGGWLTGGTC